MAPCAEQQAALARCKQDLGLLPRQCYPQTGYNGECDRHEFTLKQCLAQAVDPRSAKILYESSASRADRVAANRRLQAKLKAFNQPCTP